MASDFIKEKIKDKPLDKKKMARSVVLIVLAAIIFGIVSAVAFSITYKQIVPKESEGVREVSLSDPESQSVSSDESLSEDAVSDDSTIPGSDSDEGKTGVSEDEAGTVSGDTISDNSSGSTIINHITNQIDISPEGYAKLRRSLHDVAEEAGRSIVTVTATTTDMDWFENTYEDGNSAIGLIIADNGKQLLILTDSSVTKDAEDISVRFVDGTTVGAEIIRTDKDTSLQIIGTNLEDIDEKTKEEIAYASLGSSDYPSIVGTPIIAIGAPLGIFGSEAYGVITSMSQEEEMSDFNVHLLTTDIYGSQNASGVIIDYNGKVLGVITTAYPSKDIANMITAYSISDIKDMIENLANGKDRAYLGVIGTSVTDAAAEEYSIPKGAYVINVDPDSPAMKAGIQSGDVITRIGTKNINNYSDYTNELTELAPGVETVVTVQRFSRGDFTELSFDIELSEK
ncbi:MAG: S1C family serine protease [Lachnospiraceae bacterium]|nr:S1C family serine protease [Lachnospiraceae bacterium]